MFWAFNTKIYANLQHLASVVNSSAAVCPPFTWYEWVIEHLNVLEEFLNITISGSHLCLRYICESFSDCGRGENFINKAKCRSE